MTAVITSIVKGGSSSKGCEGLSSEYDTLLGSTMPLKVASSWWTMVSAATFGLSGTEEESIYMQPFRILVILFRALE
jgi:hypothetical protein